MSLPAPYFQDDAVTICHADCRDILPLLPKVDAVVTDPPYGWSFMGKKWDYDVPSVETWRLVLDSLKPGGHALVACGTRTQHRMAVNLEDAGFEIRDVVAWVYGSGFPKSLDISKAIDKMAGAERTKVIGTRHRNVKPFDDDNGWNPNNTTGDFQYTAPATPEAQRWQGWGTALKPAMEFWTLCRKPIEGTVAQNVLKYGTGGLNIDGCRVGTEQTTTQEKRGMHGCGSTESMRKHGFRPYIVDNRYQPAKLNPPGRFPANLIHDGSEEVAGLFPQTTVCGSEKHTTHDAGMFGIGQPGRIYSDADGANRSAARFFYCAKASKGERDQYLDSDKNEHPTIKPIALMRYLCRLITPPGGIVLDPFLGTGSTALAARLEGFKCLGIEIEERYCEIATKRMAQAVLL